MSQCASILAFLSDGLPHRMEDIHRHVGFCRLNSRVSELRGRGYEIECDKSGGEYTYRLLKEPPVAAERGALAFASVRHTGAGGSLSGGTPAPSSWDPHSPAAHQLSLLAGG